MVPCVAALDRLASSPAAALFATALAAGGLAALARRRTSLRGTTLIAQWTWSFVVLLALAAVELAAGWKVEATWIAPLRYLAAMSTFTPIMALLGAKRPQDRGWQFIVLSLWGILSLPAFEWLLFGGVAEIHPARFWFLMILIGVGATNHLGTRWWLVGLLYAVGQIFLLLPFVSATPVIGPRECVWIGLIGIVTAWTLMALDWPRKRSARLPLDSVWIDFRDAFGAVWALRVAERINSSAAMYDWHVALGWSGFEGRKTGTESAPGTNDPALDIPPAVEESLRTILRRFVSSEWIAGRLQEFDAPASKPPAATPSAR